ncbi:hypothetical protein IE53DRAFT_13859 [Violaceomyces palustris]|uniref:Uncharacterized protein n=1 Tax=Violaceomyces palustris TaxID=1673888 RepID=A0ACD0P293_9BASI|nr:hypothetical protein IE53DRAFT_13859 [Violaceomyces palustris]
MPKRFTCTHEGCDASFSKPVHLRRHDLTHSSECRWGCPYCETNFKRIDSFQRHIKHQHSVTEVADVVPINLLDSTNRLSQRRSRDELEPGAKPLQQQQQQQQQYHHHHQQQQQQQSSSFTSGSSSDEMSPSSPKGQRIPYEAQQQQRQQQHAYHYHDRHVDRHHHTSPQEHPLSNPSPPSPPQYHHQHQQQHHHHHHHHHQQPSYLSRHSDQQLGSTAYPSSQPYYQPRDLQRHGQERDRQHQPSFHHPFAYQSQVKREELPLATLVHQPHHPSPSSPPTATSATEPSLSSGTPRDIGSNSLYPPTGSYGAELTTPATATSEDNSNIPSAFAVTVSTDLNPASLAPQHQQPPPPEALSQQLHVHGGAGGPHIVTPNGEAAPMSMLDDIIESILLESLTAFMPKTAGQTLPFVDSSAGLVHQNGERT